MIVTEAFSELHVVSDLHLGGTAGGQIFDQGAQLAGLIELLAARPATGNEPLALVLNGDVVDFLAGDEARYFDPDHAVAKLDEIIAQPAFEPVFVALRAFLGKPFHRLVIAIGNHDIELSLAPVRYRLLQHLCRSPDDDRPIDAVDGLDEARRGRIDFALDGAGWAASVGRARVLVVHGNEVDDWNIVDHDTLRKVSGAMLAEAEYPKWSGNAGSRLVIDIMNAVKKRYPVVDLLKPEGRALVAVLAALDPSQLARLRSIGPTLLRYVGTRAGQALGFLGADAPAAAQTDEAALRYLLGNPQPAAGRAARDLLGQAERQLASGATPLAVAEATALAGERLGTGGLIADLFRDRPPQENLREALAKWLDWDQSFLPSTPDDTYERLDREIGPGVDFVIAGHTHLERALRRHNGAGVYFNSGTWARLIQLRRDMLQDPSAFEGVYRAFKAGTLSDLDTLPGLVLRRPTVVSVWKEGTRTLGELRHVAWDGKSARLEPVPESRLEPGGRA